MLLQIDIQYITARLKRAQTCTGVRMAASVIRTPSGFGPSRSAHTCFVPADEDDLDEEYEEELRDEEEEEDDSSGVECRVTDPYMEMTERLLRFAEIISSDVQRYFGRSRDSEPCDIYAGRSHDEVSGQQRHYSDTARAAWPDEPENLGPLAELFQSTRVKEQGLPMIQRRLPCSFWTEPGPEHRSVSTNHPDLLTCTAETMNTISSVPAMSVSSSSSSTPDFSDLLEHWASDRDTCSTYTCEYPLT